MISKKAKNVSMGTFLGISLLLVSGCGSDPEEKIIESFRKYHPDSFEKVAYEYDKKDKIGYLEFKVKNSQRITVTNCVYFKTTDEVNSGYYCLDTTYEDWDGDLEKSRDDNSLKAKRKYIDDKILAEFYKAASKSESYDMEDCIAFYKNLYEKYGSIVKANLEEEYPGAKSEEERMLTSQWDGNIYVYSQVNYSGIEKTRDGDINYYNSLNSLVRNFRGYREKAPDVVTQYFKTENMFFALYRKVSFIPISSTEQKVQVEVVDEDPGMLKIGF